ncbi:hypothetical protein GGTG_09028 [Gaeumannomyces tritici R3-111a-1]|uniref:HAUS augmin-like complex subunit 6 N-terminal domain-containing protein n=1 Tax=Gaeumannomyces tritici (strain R3-111a-1) TaxID=644352 RepID=J3P687_GAET3|nr:hypothetical protein GGTG_09028 [Gaeumannomyces tritici R3-111a-1]EJT72161.1 hypothetical protein GGTG_09028 [Gaeumannomyces tritici R3-111a-1]
MASIQTTSILARARPGRLHAARVLVTPSAASSNAAPAPTPAVLPAPPVSTAALSAAVLGSSNISLFLTNLRLLDLDLLPDWPDINPLTFTNKDIAQGQKKRIQSVEWALYQLFDLWDEEETRVKLQPFFPPMDQVQSINLRAALLRCLENAKKTGVLGRDAVVRKTMLDECKGERLEEVLAVFSSAVLKKLAAEAHLNDPTTARETPAISQVLALENRGYSVDSSGEIATLVLAHRVSLSRLLREKAEARRRYGELAQLLDHKEKVIAERTAQAKARSADSKTRTGARPMSENEKLALWRAVRNNWTGNERWMETLLYGDTHRDGILTAPFDRVWRRTRTGRLAELEEDGKDKDGQLLAQLDGRVQAQKDRLKKWQDFRKDMFGTDTARQDREQKRKSLGPAGLDPAPAQKGIDFGFGEHESLRLGSANPKSLSVKAQALKPEYVTIVEDLRQELDTISKGAANPFAGALLRSLPAGWNKDADPTCADVAEDSVPEPAELEEERPLARPRAATQGREWTHKRAEEPEPEPEQRSRGVTQPLRRTTSTREVPREPRNQDGARARPVSLVLDHNTRLPSTAAAGNRTARNGAVASSGDRRKNVSPTRDSVQEYRIQEAVPEPRTPSPPRSPPRRLAHRPAQPSQQPMADSRGQQDQEPEARPAPSQTQQLADEILDCMDNASPSPEKKIRPRHTLSLAERTRMSMVRGPQATGPVDADEDDETYRLRLKRADNNAREEALIKEAAEEDEAADDLVARTRRSMANFEATRQQVQLERRRSQRRAARESAVGHQQHRRNGGGSVVATMPTTAEERQGDGEGESVLVDEIIQRGLDEDYAAVFMSRPKIKTSPMTSPTRLWEE